MLNPAETAQAVSNSMQHKAHTPLISIIFLAIMAGAAIAMGDIFWAHSTVGMAEKQSIGLSNFIGGITFSCGLMMVVFLRWASIYQLGFNGRTCCRWQITAR